MKYSKETSVRNTRQSKCIIGNYVKTCPLLVLVSLLSIVIFGATEDVVTKSRLCIQYEINNFNSSARRCKTLNGMTKADCFMECVRHQNKSCPCRAFQLHSHNGLCELLHNLVCMTENETPGITFVGLSKCQLIPSWQSFASANQSGIWRWVRDPPTMEGTISFESPLGGVRYVTRSFHKGLYIPGWYKFFFASWGPSNSMFYCTYNIQFLIFEDPSHYRWEIFHVGDPIPSAAIIGGYWRNGSPLYMVKVILGPYDAIYPLFYNTEALRVYPIVDDMEPEMGILVGNITAK